MIRILLITLTLSLYAAPALAADKIGIPAVVPFAEQTSVREAVRNECQLGEKVASFVKRYGGRKIEFSDTPDSGKYLFMEITEVHALGGGAYSGPKWMEVTGSLLENGNEVASFRAKRFTTGGAFAGFKGTCAIIGRCTKALGKDIANWLRDPVDGAELGDAR